jgi:hypothetical protein
MIEGFKAKVVFEDKPLKSEENQIRKVDINVLKARVQESQNRENKKNILIFTFLLTVLGAVGIYFSI